MSECNIIEWLAVLWVGNRDYSRLITELRGSVGFWNVKRKYIDIGRKLGVDEETVRNRINRLKKTGLLIGWRLIPNPRLLNRGFSLLLLKNEELDSKQKTISQLESEEGVIFIINYYGDEMLIVLFDDPQQRSLNKILSRKKAKIPIISNLRIPGTNFQMTSLDWEICVLLLNDAKRKTSEMAADLGVSARTVKRRLNKMLEASAIFTIPMMNLKKMTGVAYDLMVQSQDGKKAEVESFILSKISNLVFKTGDSGNGSFITYATSNIAEGTKIFQSIENDPNVKSATLNAIEEVIHVSNWLENECKHNINIRT